MNFVYFEIENDKSQVARFLEHAMRKNRSDEKTRVRAKFIGQLMAEISTSDYRRQLSDLYDGRGREDGE